MFRLVLGALSALVLSLPAAAQVPPYPDGFRTQEIQANGTTLHVRVGGQGPAVLLLHGYGETGDMWALLAADLARDHTILAPDLRGMGLSSRPETGYDKKTQGQDMAGLLEALTIDRVDLVTHDIGNMVGYAFAAQHPERVTRFVLIDAPRPGDRARGTRYLKNPLLWHFRFQGPDVERLVAGRERIYLDRFWNEFSATPSHFTETAGSTMPNCTPCRAPCTLVLPQFARWDAGAGDRWREIVWPDDDDGDAVCRQ